MAGSFFPVPNGGNNKTKTPSLFRFSCVIAKWIVGISRGSVKILVMGRADQADWAKDPRSKDRISPNNPAELVRFDRPKSDYLAAGLMPGLMTGVID
jgi:hypothetical protein